MSEREQRSEPKEEHNSPNLVALDCGQRVVVVVEVAEQQQTVHPLDVHGQLARVQVGERRLLQLWFVSVGPFGFDLVCFVSFRFRFCFVLSFGSIWSGWRGHNWYRCLFPAASWWARGRARNPI